MCLCLRLARVQNGVTPLLLALSSAFGEAVRALLEAGAEINVKTAVR